jgi:hypothetical protein
MLGVDLVGSSLIWPAHVGGLVVQRAPDGSRPIVWMINWMIKAHPTDYRMRPFTQVEA